MSRLHEIKFFNFRLGFQKFSDANFSVRSAGKWIMLSFPLEEYDCWEDKAVWCGVRKKHSTHTYIWCSLSQPETQISCTFLPAASSQQVWSIWKMTGPTVVTVCWQWLDLPVKLHHVFIYIDGFLMYPQWCHESINHLFSSYYIIHLKMHSFDSSHHCGT